MRIGLIGYGSIGRRHCQNLLELGYNDITLLRTNGKTNEYGLDEKYDINVFLKTPFDFIIISNPTALHYKFLSELLPNNMNVLVEKPIACNSNEAGSLSNLILKYEGIGMSAYNLRFHPCIQKVNELIKIGTIGKIYAARFFVGQYLPDWRPHVDYRDSYSSKKSLGGGVVLDLIHEIDLALFFCGDIKSNFHAIVGKLSNLEIETEDVAEIHYRSVNNSFVSIHLDYLTQGYSRWFELIGENYRIHCDLFSSEVKVIGEKNKNESFYLYKEFNRNDMYLSLIKYYVECIKLNVRPKPSLSDGLSSLNLALRTKSFIEE